MSMSDPIADMLTRIRNGQKAALKVINCPFSKLKAAILDVLIREGFIVSYEKNELNGRQNLAITLKYYNGMPVIQQISRVSKPGRRVYVSKNDIPAHRNGLGISVLTTPKGVVCDAEARQHSVGGEVICTVF